MMACLLFLDYCLHIADNNCREMLTEFKIKLNKLLLFVDRPVDLAHVAVIDKRLMECKGGM